jgi:hypothetical protein
MHAPEPNPISRFFTQIYYKSLEKIFASCLPVQLNDRSSWLTPIVLRFTFHTNKHSSFMSMSTSILKRYRGEAWIVLTKRRSTSYDLAFPPRKILSSDKGVELIFALYQLYLHKNCSKIYYILTYGKHFRFNGPQKKMFKKAVNSDSLFV